MRPLSFAVITILLSALAACESDPPRAPVTPVPRRPSPTAPTPASAAPAAAAVTAVEYAYNPTAKRDPFRPPEGIRGPKSGEPGEGTCNDPLCQWDLDQLDLKAVVTGDANPFAMVVDPKGAGHIIRRNSRVGRKGGRVTRILRDQITITEYWTRPDGKRDQIQQKMTIVQDKAFNPAQDLSTGKLFD